MLIFRKHIILFCLLILSYNSIAQTKATKITTINFTTLTGGTIILNAQFDSFDDTLNFILDTGSGGISLDSATASKFKLASQPTEKLVRGIGGSRRLNYLYNKKLKLNNLIVDSLDFHINDYSVITSSYGIKIDGIIGYSFLKRFIVELDYDKNEMIVFNKGEIKYPKRGITIHPNIKNLPNIETILVDNTSQSGSLIFDTGAGLNALLTNQFCNDSNFFLPTKKKYETQGEGLAGKQAMQLTIIKKLKIGKYSFKKVPTFLFNDEVNVMNYPKNYGVLGNDILRRFNLILNYTKNEIHLKPNSHFSDDFDYSYTGLDLAQIEDKIAIIEVVKNSPADNAGLLPNDIIFSIDYNITRNIQVYKTALQNAGSKVKIVVLRNGEAIEKELAIADILH